MWAISYGSSTTAFAWLGTLLDERDRGRTFIFGSWERVMVFNDYIQYFSNNFQNLVMPQSI